MTRVKRTILALILVELMLAGLWFYLAGLAASPEDAREIGKTMGTVMGVILGVSPVLLLLARSNDRKAAAKRSD